MKMRGMFESLELRKKDKGVARRRHTVSARYASPTATMYT